MKRVCVFCGSKTGTNPIYAEAATQLGRILVSRRLELVFGGGHVGLMGVVADSVLATGGRVLGVIPQALKDKELAHTGSTELYVVESMHQRKALMNDLSDAFIAMPGGFGTGDELFEIITWRQLDIHAKPIGILNIQGYFDPMLHWVERMIHDGFVKPEYRDLFYVAEEAETMVERLESAMERQSSEN